jgi:hypothetical protein
MMTIFLADGKMDMIKIIKAAMDNLMYNTPTWVVSSGTHINTNNLNNGYSIIDYKGPPPKVVKL